MLLQVRETVPAPGRRGSAAAAIAVVVVLMACVVLLLALRLRGEREQPRVAAGNAPVVQAVNSAAPDDAEAERIRQEWAAMVKSEDLLDELTKDASPLARAAGNLELPDARTRVLFSPDGVTVVDLASEPETTVRTLPSVGVTVTSRDVEAEARRVPRDELRLLRPLLAGVDRFEQTFVKIASGRFRDADPPEYEGRVRLTGRAVMRSGEISHVTCWQDIVWRRLPGASGEKREHWRIVEWRVTSCQRQSVLTPLFRDVLAEVVRDPEQLRRARHSVHSDLVSKALLDPEGFKPPHPYFNLPSQDRHPGVSVVDLDRDGFDDLYLGERWGKNQFFRNQGDGTFVEEAALHALDIAGDTNGSLFADFDNDGDADLLLARGLSQMAYLVNDGSGHFEDRTQEMLLDGQGNPGAELMLASSINAVDYDGDGLLDAFVSTFASDIFTAMLEEAGSLRGGIQALGRAARMSPAEMNELARIMATSYDSHLDFQGPPNLLLHGVGGGRLQQVEDPGALAAYRHTYQAAWSDFDGDGDPDAYLSNDFAPDNLVRNDGDGKFTDVTEELGIREQGYGMGISWGDYDRDGQQDFYVTNMKSTAGLRITSQLSMLRPEYRQMAEGNFLYRHMEEGGFKKVSGHKAPELLVEAAGWSWGSQFVDIDNDGYLDIYAPSGYYTAPPEARLEGDT